MKLWKMRTGTTTRWVKETHHRFELLPDSFTLAKLLSQSSPHDWLSNVSGVMTYEKYETCAPIEDQEVWASGVTYEDSRRARLIESTNNSVYDRVYSAQRPQIFPKSRGRNVIGPGECLRLRHDSRWMVPEPELVLVLNSVGSIVGATIGNDLSCRDIEGENPLYQPQAKIWAGSCALGPALIFIRGSHELSSLEIKMRIIRSGKEIFSGRTQTNNIVRPFDTLSHTLFEYREFPDGAFLFTGTGIIPPDDFSLTNGDEIKISITGLGELTNVALDGPQPKVQPRTQAESLF